MGKKIYIGKDNLARRCPRAYIGVDGVARKIKRAYIGVDGVARLFFTSSLIDRFLGNVAYSNDAGDTWTARNVTQLSKVGSLALGDNALFTSPSTRRIIQTTEFTYQKSTDHGATWTEQTIGEATRQELTIAVVGRTGVSTSIWASSLYSSHIASNGNDVFATYVMTGYVGQTTDTIVCASVEFYSHDNGATWTRLPITSTYMLYSAEWQLGDSHKYYSWVVGVNGKFYRYNRLRSPLGFLSVSADGENWTSIGTSTNRFRLSGYLVGKNEILQYSQEGSAWEKATINLADDTATFLRRSGQSPFVSNGENLLGFHAFDRWWVMGSTATSTDGVAISTSTDGLTWTNTIVCPDIVDGQTYRRSNLWYANDKIHTMIQHGSVGYYSTFNGVTWTHKRVDMPNGVYMAETELGTLYD